MTTQCTNCKTYYSEQDFYEFCDDKPAHCLYEFAESVILDNEIHDTKLCVCCGSPVTLVRPLNTPSSEVH